MIRRSHAALGVLCLFSAACGPEVGIGTATFALGEVPESVETISVFVRQAGRSEVVASSTLGASRSRFALGVPAEVPLEITAVARSDRPAPESLGGHMPIYVARTVRTVPLGNEATVIPLDARPGGALTVLVDGPDEGGDVRLRLRGAAESRVLQVRLPLRGTRFMRVLGEGRWSAESDDPNWELVGGQGLWAAPAVDTFARLRLQRVPAAVSLDAPQALAIEVRSQDRRVSSLVSTSTQGPTRLELVVRALDASGQEVPVPPALVSVRVTTVPVGLSSEFPALQGGLPLSFDAWTVQGVGRLHLEVQAVFNSGRILRSSWHANLGEVGGQAAQLLLEVADEAELVEGTALRALLLDSEGRLSIQGPWDLDAGESDAWAHFGQGASVRMTGPVATLALSRPSGPRGLGVVLRAVATSTAFSGTLTSTLTLPAGPLEGARAGDRL